MQVIVLTLGMAIVVACGAIEPKDWPILSAEPGDDTITELCKDRRREHFRANVRVPVPSSKMMVPITFDADCPWKWVLECTVPDYHTSAGKLTAKVGDDLHVSTTDTRMFAYQPEGAAGLEVFQIHCVRRDGAYLVHYPALDSMGTNKAAADMCATGLKKRAVKVENKAFSLGIEFAFASCEQGKEKISSCKHDDGESSNTYTSAGKAVSFPGKAATFQFKPKTAGSPRTYKLECDEVKGATITKVK